MRDVLAGWCILSVVATLAWCSYRELAERQAARDRARRAAQLPTVGHWDDEAIEHPHPQHHPLLYVDATSDDEAWRAIGGTAA